MISTNSKPKNDFFNIKNVIQINSFVKFSLQIHSFQFFFKLNSINCKTLQKESAREQQFFYILKCFKNSFTLNYC